MQEQKGEILNRKRLDKMEERLERLEKDKFDWNRWLAENSGTGKLFSIVFIILGAVAAGYYVGVPYPAQTQIDMGITVLSIGLFCFALFDFNATLYS